MAGHYDGHRVLAERVAHSARSARLADACRNLIVGQHFSPTDAARLVEYLARKVRHQLQVDFEFELLPLAREVLPQLRGRIRDAIATLCYGKISFGPACQILGFGVGSKGHEAQTRIG